MSAPAPEVVPVQNESRTSKTRLQPVRRDSKPMALPKNSPATGAQAAVTAQAAPAVPAAKPSQGSNVLLIGGGIAAVVGLALIFVFGGSQNEPEKKTAVVNDPANPSAATVKSSGVEPSISETGPAKPAGPNPTFPPPRANRPAPPQMRRTRTRRPCHRGFAAPTP